MPEGSLLGLIGRLEVRSELVSTPKSTQHVMPEFKAVSSALVSAIKRPGCPNCRQSRMMLSKLEAGPSGFDTRTFECQKCGRLHTTVVAGDPMTSGMLGWFAGELRPPT